MFLGRLEPDLGISDSIGYGEEYLLSFIKELLCMTYASFSKQGLLIKAYFFFYGLLSRLVKLILFFLFKFFLCLKWKFSMLLFKLLSMLSSSFRS